MPTSDTDLLVRWLVEVAGLGENEARNAASQRVLLQVLLNSRGFAGALKEQPWKTWTPSEPAPAQLREAPVPRMVPAPVSSPVTLESDDGPDDDEDEVEAPVAHVPAPRTRLRDGGGPRLTLDDIIPRPTRTRAPAPARAEDIDEPAPDERPARPARPSRSRRRPAAVAIEEEFQPQDAPRGYQERESYDDDDEAAATSGEPDPFQAFISGIDPEFGFPLRGLSPRGASSDSRRRRGRRRRGRGRTGSESPAS